MDLALLKKVTEAPGVSGFEEPIRSVIFKEIQGLADEIYTDALGNLIALKKGKQPKKLAIAAHMDEIGFIATHIDDEGFIRFHTLGGFDPKTLTAQRVLLHGKETILGVMGTKPIHVMSAEERNKMPKTTDFFIDTGLPAEKVKELIPIGTPITRERELIQMGPCINAKSLDNRISVYILIELLRKMKDETPAFDTYAIFSVQEEVGLRGAITAASGIAPDFGIGLDVTLAYDLPGASPHEVVTKLGKGTAIKVLDGTAICDYRMVNFMRKTAEAHQIRHQMEILTAGGTDTAGLQRSGKGGAIAGAISIPTRYLHQVIEMVHEEDVKDTISLLHACTMEMNQFNTNFSL